MAVRSTLQEVPAEVLRQDGVNINSISSNPSPLSIYLLTAYPFSFSRTPSRRLQVQVEHSVVDVALNVVRPGDGGLAADHVQELVIEDHVAVGDLHAVEGLLQAGGGHAVGARVDDVLEVEEVDAPAGSTALEGPLQILEVERLAHEGGAHAADGE